ncbi:MAG: transporter, family, multidrug resistance protein [Pyrinomonadaceae bacterium]|jgi:DHA2 family multidrug resistance protein|nr:transporter, family, multidrug resistance protein [Pyrinomonadaceae bacterium]
MSEDVAPRGRVPERQRGSTVAKNATVPTETWTPSFNPWLIAAAVMIATFMEVLDTSVANVSLPHIAGTLSASTEEATWVLTSYLVANAVILPITGWLSSFFGRKRLLITCIIIFTLSSALCGAATSMTMLIVARVLQGIGGGVLQPTAQAVLMESFPFEKRGQAMAVYAMGIIVAPIIGPTLGGWITDNYSWRWIFYINVPVGIAAVLMAVWFIENPPYLKRIVGSRIDYLGFALLTVCLATFQLVLDTGQQNDWFASRQIVLLTAVSVTSLIAFVMRELTVAEPIVDLRILKNRNFGVGTLLMTIVGGVLYSTTALLPLFLQTLLGYPALQSGMAISPRGIGSMASMIVVGRLVGKIDSRLLMTFGFFVLATSMYLLAGVNLEIASSNIVWPSLINGFAMGFIFVPLTTVAMGTLKREQMGNAAGIYSLMRNIGGGLGISAVTTLLARGAQQHQAVMVSHLTPYDSAFQQRMQQLQGVFGTTAAGAQKAYLSLYGTLIRQATLLAFVDNFRLLTFVCLACIPLVFLLKRVGSGGGGSAALH